MKRLVYILAACVAIVSCSKELTVQDVKKDGGERLATIHATIEGMDALTKTTYTEDLDNLKGKFKWEAGDQICVVYEDGGYSYKTFTTTGGDSFTGTVSGTEGGDVFHVAVYPQNIVKSIYASSGKESIHLLLPSVVDGDGSNIIPMIAHCANASFSGAYEFKHIGSVIRFSMTNIPLTAKQLVISCGTGDAGADLAGTFYTTYDSGNDVYTYTSGSNDDGEQRSVTYNFTPNSDGTYAFYLPFGTGQKPWFNFTFTFKDKNGDAICSKTTTLSSLKDISLAKNTIYRVKLDAYTCPNYPVKKITINPSDLPSTASTTSQGAKVTVGGIDFYAYRVHKNELGDMEFLNNETWTDDSTMSGDESMLYNADGLGQITSIKISRGATTMWGPKVFVGAAACPKATKVSVSSSVDYSGDGYDTLTYDISGSNSYFSIINISKYHSYTGAIEISYKSYK